AGGGAIYMYNPYCNLNIDNCTLSGNATARNGGAVLLYLGGNLNVTNSTISGNSSGNNGGALYSFNIVTAADTHTIRNSTIAGNTAGGAGSAIAIIYNSG